MIIEFEEPVFNLEIGKISDPIKTTHGYHVVIVEDKIDETVDFEEAKEEIKDYFKEQDYQDHMEQLIKNADIIKREQL